MEFQEKFVAFIDILGFKSLVHSAENGGDVNLKDITEALEHLGSKSHIERIKKHGPNTCPQSERISKDVGFEITQVSDCAVISCEISPLGALTVVNHCWAAVLNLLMKGFMCRGYITRGIIYHSDEHVIGSGYQNAYSKESEVSAFKQETDERGTPYVEVDPVVCDFIENSNDKCCKEMFSRYVKKDGDTTVIFPFQRLGHSFILMGGFEEFNPRKEKEANNNVRLLLNRLKNEVSKYVDSTNPKAVLKLKHYIAALDSQLEACDKTDKVIDMWS